MAQWSRRFPNNAPGRYYVDDECIFCNLCAELAPSNFAEDNKNGHDYVNRQPLTRAEEESCMEAMESCPVDAIGNNGR